MNTTIPNNHFGNFPNDYTVAMFETCYLGLRGIGYTPDIRLYAAAKRMLGQVQAMNETPTTDPDILGNYVDVINYRRNDFLDEVERHGSVPLALGRLVERMFNFTKKLFNEKAKA